MTDHEKNQKLLIRSSEALTDHNNRLIHELKNMTKDALQDWTIEFFRLAEVVMRDANRLRFEEKRP